MDFYQGMMAPPPSACQELDRMVQASERPYGYTLPPPPADTHDYNSSKLESHKGKRNG